MSSVPLPCIFLSAFRSAPAALREEPGWWAGTGLSSLEPPPKALSLGLVAPSAGLGAAQPLLLLPGSPCSPVCSARPAGDLYLKDMKFGVWAQSILQVASF